MRIGNSFSYIFNIVNRADSKDQPNRAGSKDRPNMDSVPDTKPFLRSSSGRVGIRIQLSDSKKDDLIAKAKEMLAEKKGIIIKQASDDLWRSRDCDKIVARVCNSTLNNNKDINTNEDREQLVRQHLLCYAASTLDKLFTQESNIDFSKIRKDIHKQVADILGINASGAGKSFLESMARTNIDNLKLCKNIEHHYQAEVTNMLTNKILHSLTEKTNDVVVQYCEEHNIKGTDNTILSAKKISGLVNELMNKYKSKENLIAFTSGLA